jgi:molybdenum cofactor cytidylyltransferase
MNSGLYWCIVSPITIAKWIAPVKTRGIAWRMENQPAAVREEVDCIVPAGGRSERMGSWKPLLPFDGTSIIERVVERALSVCARVILVTGYRAGELETAFRGRARVSVIENGDWRLGMFSSIRCGAAAVVTGRFFVTLGDMPWIESEVYGALLRCTETDVVFPVFDGMRGHPVLFRHTVQEEILRADPAQGSMRAVAARFSVGELPWRDDSILRDIDTRKDLAP